MDGPSVICKKVGVSQRPVLGFLNSPKPDKVKESSFSSIFLIELGSGRQIGLMWSWISILVFRVINAISWYSSLLSRAIPVVEIQDIKSNML